MKLIADSGSTKCDWVILDGEDRRVDFSTMGFNPFYHSIEFIRNAISNDSNFLKYGNAITQVFYYGSGCSSEVRCDTVSSALEATLPNAEVFVGHDVLGAAIAACQGKEGIACILGTGSNSCYYDGKEVSEVVPSLGYILGDEGSGAWFGKQLMVDYLYKKELPFDLKKELADKGFSKESVLENIYMKPHANVYLASFMKIISNHRETDYVQQLISDGLKQFLAIHVCCYDNCKTLPVSFVGSVAYFFKDVLTKEAEKLGITVGNVIQKPIDGLATYHK